MKRTIQDKDLIAIHVIRRALNPLPWTMATRVILYCLREVWPEAHGYLMREQCYRDRL